MEPTLNEGDLIIYKPIHKSNELFSKGSIVVAKNPSNQREIIIKRVNKKNDVEVELIGDNSNYSVDSRHFGAIKIDEVIGLVEQIIPNES